MRRTLILAAALASLTLTAVCNDGEDSNGAEHTPDSDSVSTQPTADAGNAARANGYQPAASFTGKDGNLSPYKMTISMGATDNIARGFAMKDGDGNTTATVGDAACTIQGTEKTIPIVFAAQSTGKKPLSLTFYLTVEDADGNHVTSVLDGVDIVWLQKDKAECKSLAAGRGTLTLSANSGEMRSRQGVLLLHGKYIGYKLSLHAAGDGKLDNLKGVTSPVASTALLPIG